jgi:hypothetical protein
MIFTADDIWGAVAAAHRINEGYSKEDVWVQHDANPSYRIKQANKLMVKEWIRDNNFSVVTAEDREKGQEIRTHFNSYMLLMLTGKINDFQRKAYKISQMEDFSEHQLAIEIGIACSLPSVYERDLARAELMEQLRASTPLSGQIGDRVEGEITVLESRYNAAFDRFRISARMGSSIVYFWYGAGIAQGTVTQIRGRIKAVQEDNGTQLHYVKTIG